MSDSRSQTTPRKVLVCAGDSITHGRGSADYVGLLEHRLSTNDIQLFNAGVGGDLAWNLLQRIDHVIARQPDVVVVLIGTNDVNATVNRAVGTYLRLSKRLPRRPTLDWYVECIGQILTRLQNETSARLAVLDIPMIGEDLDSVMNARVDEYNEALRQVASSRGVTCLPLHDRLVGLLPAGHQPSPYRGSLNVVASAVFRHRLLRQSWDSVAEHNGLAVLTDHIHLSDRGAGAVADLIERFLVLPSGQPDGLS